MIKPDKLFGQLGNRMFQMAYIHAQCLDGKIPDTYLQDEKYFAKYKDIIKALYSSGIGKVDQVAIHVRRGDYVKNPFYVDLMETDYYEKAMSEFRDKEFLVFSDDIEWCKQQPIFNGCHFSTEKDNVADLNLMASCTGHIIANSSFSWWGAYLSPHGGKVIAPKKWYTDMDEERTVCPKEWKRI